MNDKNELDEFTFPSGRIYYYQDDDFKDSKIRYEDKKYIIILNGL